MPTSLFPNLTQELIEKNTINESLYSELDVKRGLRNADGSGVLAGLTMISSVTGTTKTDTGMQPADGILKYRGTRLKDLCAQLTSEGRFQFEKTAFLLLVGRLPKPDELQTLVSFMGTHRTLPKRIVSNIIQAVPSPNVMNKLQTTISALYAEDTNPDSLSPYDNFLKSIEIIAKIPTIVAYAYLAYHNPTVKFVEAPDDMSTAEAFLTMLHEGNPPTQLEIDILDLSLVIHAEHGGGNNSSFTAHVVSSSGTDIYSALAAAISSLKGPLHGAANSKVREMMTDIKAHLSDWKNVDQLTAHLTKIINKDAHDKSGKIYGLGHAVYTKSDPRAIILKEQAIELAKAKGREDEYQLYLNIEEYGPKLFQEIKKSNKVISPNVDFFSGFVYDCLGIPQAVYTPMFAMARSAGWCAHRLEEILSGKRIIRPKYQFVQQ